MAQHDYVIANGTGAAVRSDLNNALAAIVSNNSGATEPATMYAYQWWADTSTGLLKLRNAANNAWISLRELDGTLTIEDGTASSPGLAFADDLNTGIYSPSADQLGITTGGTVRLTTTTTGITSALPVDVPLGTASAPTVTFTGDLNTGIYSPGADQVAISTNGSGRLFVDSSGRVGVGTSSPSNLFHVFGTGGTPVSFERTGSNGVFIGLKDGSGNSVFLGNTNGVFSVQTPGSSFSDKLVITSAGLVGIGTTSPTRRLDIEAATANVGITGTSNSYIDYVISGSNIGIIGDANWTFGGSSSNLGIRATSNLVFGIGANERARIDSSGRLLVGTSSARAFGGLGTPSFQQEGTGYETASGAYTLNQNTGDSPWLILAKSRGSSLGSFTVVNSGDVLGRISFQGADGTVFRQGASITAEVDATPGSGDMPGRLVFSTTADGASSPTERMRIRADGGVSSYAPSGTTWDLRWNGDTDQVRSIQIIGGASGILSGGTERLRIWNNGDAQNRAGVWGSLSDAKLKTNITDAASQWDDIKSLRVRKYNLLDDLEHAHIGVIAQELELTSPGLVTSHPDLDESGCETGEYTKAVKNSILYMKAVKALQEAMERIEQLEQRLTDAGIA